MIDASKENLDFIKDKVRNFTTTAPAELLKEEGDIIAYKHNAVVHAIWRLLHVGVTADTLHQLGVAYGKAFKMEGLTYEQGYLVGERTLNHFVEKMKTSVPNGVKMWEPDRAAQAEAMIAYAKAHITSNEDLISGRPLGQDPGFQGTFGPYHIVFTFELQNEPVGLSRHMSVLLPEGWHHEQPAVLTDVRDYMRLFGFKDVIPNLETNVQALSERADKFGANTGLSSFRYLAMRAPLTDPTKHATAFHVIEAVDPSEGVGT